MEDSEPNQNSRPQKAQALSACMAMLLPWTPFFRFTSCQPRGDPAQGINMGGLAQKIRRRGSRKPP